MQGVEGELAVEERVKTKLRTFNKRVGTYGKVLAGAMEVFEKTDTTAPVLVIELVPQHSINKSGRTITIHTHSKLYNLVLDTEEKAIEWNAELKKAQVARRHTRQDLETEVSHLKSQLWLLKSGQMSLEEIEEHGTQEKKNFLRQPSKTSCDILARYGITDLFKYERVVVFGSINMDLMAQIAKTDMVFQQNCKGDRFVMSGGGKGANECLALARLSIDAALVSRVGNDDFGRLMRQHLTKEKVNIRHVRTVLGGDTPVAVLISGTEDHRKATITCSNVQNNGDPNDDLDRLKRALEGSRARFLLLQNEVDKNLNREAAALACKLGKRVIFKAGPLTSPDEIHKNLLKSVHVLFCNEREAPHLVPKSKLPPNLTRIQDASTAARAILTTHTSLEMVCVTTYACHLLAVRKGHKLDMKAHGLIEGVEFDYVVVPSFYVRKVDVIGAADAFVGGFTAALMFDLPLSKGLVWAQTVATLCSMGMGAQDSIPTLDNMFRLQHVMCPKLWEWVDDGSMSGVCGVMDKIVGGDVIGLRQFLQGQNYGNLRNSKPDVNLSPTQQLLSARDIYGQSALHLAVLTADVPLCCELLEAGADPLVKDLFGTTPLQRAMVSLKQNMKLKTNNPFRKLLKLMCAAVVLTNKGPDAFSPFRVPHGVGIVGEDILFEESEEEFEKAVKYFIAKPAKNEHEEDLTDDPRKGPEIWHYYLRWAFGVEESIDFLDASDTYPAIVHVARDILCEQNPTDTTDPAAEATQKLVATLLNRLLANETHRKKLIALSEKMEARTPQQPHSLLAAASFAGQTSLMKQLKDNGHELELGEAPTLRTQGFKTALHFAARSGKLKACQMLISWRYQLSSTDENGLTPLQSIDAKYLRELERLGHVNDVFISYSHRPKTSEHAHKIAKVLEKNDITVWIDDKIRQGDEWKSVIGDALKLCKIMVVIISDEWMDSGYCRGEFEAARQTYKPIITIVPPSFPAGSVSSQMDASVHRILGDKQFFDYRKGNFDGITEELVQTIKKNLGYEAQRLIAKGTGKQAVDLAPVLESQRPYVLVCGSDSASGLPAAELLHGALFQYRPNNPAFVYGNERHDPLVLVKLTESPVCCCLVLVLRDTDGEDVQRWLCSILVTAHQKGKRVILVPFSTKPSLSAALQYSRLSNKEQKVETLPLIDITGSTKDGLRESDHFVQMVARLYATVSPILEEHEAAQAKEDLPTPAS